MSDTHNVTTSKVSASLAAVSAKLAGGTPPTSAAGEDAISQPSGKKATKAKPEREKAKTTKAAAVEKLLQRKAGATIDQIVKATGWQAHTCRAFLTGLRKKGQEVVRETGKDGKSVYRIEASVPDGKTG